ncbi:hypothetical protein AB833_10595 [Chromatiales bacterium (ex Bugula neritina AB1)]|nr:hypothetical protein AB833_10595 [Chromatiales bacterium (ex Bugula neritina AB1)]
MYQFAKACNVALLTLAISACTSSSDSNTAKIDGACSTDNIKQWAYDNLNDYYLFADQVSTVNPQSYTTANELVKDLRVQPFDRFSYVTDTSTSDEVFIEGKLFGIGYQWQPDSEDRVVISAVHANSPLGLTGTINRGDQIAAINGVQLQDLTEAQFNEFTGTREQPARANWTFIDGQTNQSKTVALTPALYDMNTVFHSEVIEHPDHSGKIGYMVFDVFVRASEAELDATLTTFRNEGINELVLDLRYNGGGLVDIATKLSSQIAGAVTDGKPLMEYRHNNKYSEEFDFSLQFSDEPIDLGLERLIVLTTERTASSSEIVISSLSPYIEVVTIGSRTTGKPYITFGNEYCDKQMHALQAEGFNANNVSVYGGIAPSCGATDDLTRNFGYSTDGGTTEGMLQSAIDYIVQGTCNTPATAADPVTLNDGSNGLSIIDSFSENRLEPGARYNREIN